ncbi:MAG: hypothetical protein HYX42_08215 [Polaromonas sp.]|uniref:hypothetical protein n=1 Tax=Polaromonas sp. TaxID=1869339 RepID=UPI0025CC7ABA|nr:hypothetical protein [Polaromonas sp.]MBI2726218.1 hypothetical protein [Polaromonas sp.]
MDTKPYVVSLEHVIAMPAAEKISAEMRFIKELDKSLGGSEAVVATFMAWKEACDCDAAELSSDIASLAVRWPKAFEAAQRAGLKNIGEGEAHFELHLA